MDFNSFSKSAHQRNENTSTHSTYNAPNTGDYIKDAYDKYSKLSSDDMMRELYKAVAREKASGLFNIDNLWSFYKNISPMLDSQDRAKMRDIIDSIDLG